MNRNLSGIMTFFIGATLTTFSLLGTCDDKKNGDVVTFRGNLARRGVYPKGAPEKLTEKIFEFQTKGDVRSSPAVSGGIVYFGSHDECFYAVDVMTGKEK